MNTLVETIMKQPVVSCSLPNDIGTVRDLMNQKSCHSILMVEIGEDQKINVRGIVTSSDLVGLYDDTVDVQQIMTRDVHFITPGTSAQVAAQMMIDYKTHHLLVMESDNIVGIVSSLDFVQLIAAKGI